MPKYTRSGRLTALGDVEAKLKRQYPNNPRAVYGTLNRIGLMRGNRATRKGTRAAKRK